MIGPHGWQALMHQLWSDNLPMVAHCHRHPAGPVCLVHAHGVFVYLSLLHAFEYFLEMIRECTPHGHICFDFFRTEAFDEPMIMRWLEYPDRYPVVLSSRLVESFFTQHGLSSLTS